MQRKLYHTHQSKVTRTGWPLHKATVGVVRNPPAFSRRHTSQPRQRREQEAAPCHPAATSPHTFWAPLASTLHLGGLSFLVCVEGNPEMPQSSGHIAVRRPLRRLWPRLRPTHHAPPSQLRSSTAASKPVTSAPTTVPSNLEKRTPRSTY